MPAAGYRSVTVRQKQYDALKTIANQRGKSIMELLEMLIEQYSRPYVRAIIDEIAASKSGFEAPYHAFVLDSKTKHYQSTSWVRTEEYVNRMRDPMLRKIEDRIRNDDELNVDKIFILSPDSWNKKEVWRWIAEWLTFRYLREKQLRIFVLKEKTAGEILATKQKGDQKTTQRKYYDMGIYQLAQDISDPWDTVGYLKIDDQSRPGQYTRIRRCDDVEEVKRAERYFADFKKKAQAIENMGDIERLQKQSYD